MICVTQAARENPWQHLGFDAASDVVEVCVLFHFDAEVDVEFLVVACDSGRGSLDGFDAGCHVVTQRIGERVALHPYLPIGGRYDQVGARWTGQT